jgi:predicted RecB family endonuclease
MKKGLAKLEETEMAWETHAPDDKFYGLTLTEFKAKVQRSRDARALISSLDQQLTAAKNECTDVDAENLALEKNIAKAIAGSEKYGDDSALYEGTGRIRKSERASGLTRKKKNGNENE